MLIIHDKLNNIQFVNLFVLWNEFLIKLIDKVFENL